MKIIRSLSAFLISSFVLSAQTAQYPTALATTSDLLVAKNRAQTVTTASFDATTLTIPVQLGTVFTAPTDVTIDAEIIKICTVATSVITACVGGRGFDGSTAAAHTNSTQVLGNINAWYHNASAAEIIAIEAFLGVNGTGAGFATTAGTNNFTGRQNAANAASTAPFKSGNTLPATCTANDLFYKANATSGQRLYACESTDTWVLQAGGGSSSVTAGDGILVVGSEVAVDPSFVNTAAGSNTNTGALFDNSAVSITAPARVNSSAPISCRLGDMWIDTSQSAAEQTKVCTTAGTPGTFTVQGSGASAPKYSIWLGTQIASGPTNISPWTFQGTGASVNGQTAADNWWWGWIDMSDTNTDQATTLVGLHPDYSGAIDIRVYFVNKVASSGDIRIGASLGCITPGTTDAYNLTFNTESLATVTASANNIPFANTFTAVTSTGCTAGGQAVVRVRRIGGDAADTFTGDISFTGALLLRAQ